MALAAANEFGWFDVATLRRRFSLDQIQTRAYELTFTLPLQYGGLEGSDRAERGTCSMWRNDSLRRKTLPVTSVVLGELGR